MQPSLLAKHGSVRLCNHQRLLGNRDPIKIALALCTSPSHSNGFSMCSSRCSGAISLARVNASDRFSVMNVAPKFANASVSSARRGKDSPWTSIAALTCSAKPREGVIRIAAHSGPCSACEMRSAATKSGSAVLSAMTRISLGGPLICLYPHVHKPLSWRIGHRDSPGRQFYRQVGWF